MGKLTKATKSRISTSLTRLTFRFVASSKRRQASPHAKDSNPAREYVKTSAANPAQRDSPSASFATSLLLRYTKAVIFIISSGARNMADALGETNTPPTLEVSP